MASQEVLLAFVQAATQGSFSAAARKLGRSQSTISAAVASLEIDLNLTLFDRSSRKPEPDPGRARDAATGRRDPGRHQPPGNDRQPTVPRRRSRS